MLPSYNYPRRSRLLNKQAFDQVFRSSHLNLRQYPFLLLCAESEHDYARLGALTPKKFLPRAFDRNKIKRLCREQFRLMRADLPPVDIVVMCKKFDRFSRRQLRTKLQGLFQRLIVQQTKIQQGNVQQGEG